jgi:hypothetical protein
LYSSKPTHVLGFHGLDEAIGRKILNGEDNLKHSINSYDWLGHGVYFWENSPERASHWAKQSSERAGSVVRTPFVLGAILDLKTCFDLLDQKWIDFLKMAFDDMTLALEEQNCALPNNQPWGANDIDFKKRELDCAVIRYAISKAKADYDLDIDSVRSAFWEGDELYPNAGFKTHSHIQLSIINPDCIKGIFLPRQKTV